MKWLKIALVVLAVALVGVICWQVVRPSDEPVYKGRTLTSWLENYARVPLDGYIRQEHETDMAVSQIGTNAVPTLLRLLHKKDSAFKVKLMALLARQHVITVDYTPAEDWNKAALVGVQVLETNAQTAVPDLIEFAKQDTSPSSQYIAIASLGYIGPQAKQAVPYLLQWATNRTLKRFAIPSLWRIDPEAAVKAGITITNTVP
jgi:hypothetical protein